MEIKQKKTIQCNLRVIAGYLTSIRAPESEQYFAVPGQEFLGLLVAVRLQEHIHRIFPDALHQRKREDTLKT